MKKKSLKIILLILTIFLVFSTLIACGETGDGDQNPSNHTCVYDKKVVSETYLKSPATCMEKAVYYYSCSCKKMGEKTFEHGDKASHSYTNYVSDGNATYESDGTKTAQCDYGCGKTNTVTDEGSKLTPGHTHDFSKKVESATYLKSNATCTTGTIYFYSCSCGEKGQTTFEVGDKLPHNFEIYVYNYDAKCGVNGTEFAYCTRGCGTTDTREKQNTALSHSFTEYVSDQNATYESDGTKTASCDHGCGETDTVIDVGSMLVHSGLVFNNLNVVGTNVSGVFANTVEEFSFLDEIEQTGNAKYVVALDELGIQIVTAKKVRLNVGDNVFYVFETLDGELENTYTVTLRRRPMYAVTFNTNGGNIVQEQIVEESYFATAPTPQRAGYDFVSWDYDFSKPIKSDVTINAIWIARSDTPYVVEHYLKKTSYGYTKELIEHKTGVTDSIVEASIKDFYGFYPEELSITGQVAADGTLVLKVYYSRIYYDVTFAVGDDVIFAGEKVISVSYEGKVEFPEVTKTYYVVSGWYLDPNFEVEFTKDSTVNRAITLYPKYELRKYRVDFCAQGSVAYTKYYTINDIDEFKYNLPDVPDEYGYEGRWESFNLNFEDISVNAEYHLKQYKINYLCKDGYCIYHQNPTSYTIEDYVVNINNNEHVSKWCTKDGKTVTSINTNEVGDVTLYAQYDNYEAKIDEVDVNKVSYIANVEPVLAPSGYLESSFVVSETRFGDDAKIDFVIASSAGSIKDVTNPYVSASINKNGIHLYENGVEKTWEENFSLDIGSIFVDFYKLTARYDVESKKFGLYARLHESEDLVKFFEVEKVDIPSSNVIYGLRLSGDIEMTLYDVHSSIHDSGDVTNLAIDSTNMCSGGVTSSNGVNLTVNSNNTQTWETNGVKINDSGFITNSPIGTMIPEKSKGYVMNEGEVLAIVLEDIVGYENPSGKTNYGFSFSFTRSLNSTSNWGFDTNHAFSAQYESSRFNYYFKPDEKAVGGSSSLYQTLGDLSSIKNILEPNVSIMAVYDPYAQIYYLYRKAVNDIDYTLEYKLALADMRFELHGWNAQEKLDAFKLGEKDVDKTMYGAIRMTGDLKVTVGSTRVIKLNKSDLDTKNLIETKIIS
ncbi:MAG: InlB B-repeat-containing protein [Clostridia bacterium]|nr:InlB B-repeat-containing protein [Clostridia bacterium]